jgi:hypothetical protein
MVICIQNLGSIPENTGVLILGLSNNANCKNGLHNLNRFNDKKNSNKNRILIELSLNELCLAGGSL